MLASVTALLGAIPPLKIGLLAFPVLGFHILLHYLLELFHVHEFEVDFSWVFINLRIELLEPHLRVLGQLRTGEPARLVGFLAWLLLALLEVVVEVAAVFFWLDHIVNDQLYLILVKPVMHHTSSLFDHFIRLLTAFQLILHVYGWETLLRRYRRQPLHVLWGCPTVPVNQRYHAFVFVLRLLHCF